MRIAVYPGSFDPATLGHLDIITRASKLVDKLIVGVLNNNTKNPLFNVDERVGILKDITKDIDNVEVQAFSGLLVEFAKKNGANMVVRGLRAITDFEYEIQMAQTNRILDEGVDTIFLTTNIEYSYLSSSTVKEVAMFGGDISKFLPESVIPLVKEKYKNKI
ncbi:MAG TPA: pantetheine-phosphate adenylyltransferase [Eubacterium sp.]|jgi:pantetheine-phosphate adenylyltransferase|nr:pantetheine-phosphate adenylyltransferase [Eubacterium sp.]HBZ52391.1 pantetheine-phosphate adenylyltransferase [Eubacterium sp.]